MWQMTGKEVTFILFWNMKTFFFLVTSGAGKLTLSEFWSLLLVNDNSKNVHFLNAGKKN